MGRLGGEWDADGREWDIALNATADLISIHDAEYRIVKVNAALLTFIKKAPEEVLGRKCYEVFHGTPEPPSHCPHTRTIRAGIHQKEDFFEPHLGIRVLVTVSPIFDANRNPIASVHIVRDMSETVRSPDLSDPGTTWAPTERQTQILQLFCRGRVTKEIASQLKISPRTVEYHKCQMMKQVSARSLPQLIVHALTRGYLRIG
jgi:PAS domain S-box-containing protein